MRKHIAYLVLKEGRPFSFADLLKFEVNGFQYHMAQGTSRNKVSAMLKTGEIEVAYYSSVAFYTLKGVKFTKRMTVDHTGGPLSSICTNQDLRYIKNHPVYRVIQNIPFDTSALHDIRLRFAVNGIWRLLSRNSTLSMNDNSKDIHITQEEINALNVRVTVHRTDTISIVIGCSYSPVAVDSAGVIRLSNALPLIHDRLQLLITDCDPNSGLVIPNHMTWIVSMWHFGADASLLYKGKSFHVSWKVAENALVAFYSKIWKDGKYRIRAERQEYPHTSLDEAFNEKLKLNGGVHS